MNNNRTYIAFDADGVRRGEESNLHIFRTLGDWQKRYPNRYTFVNIESINFQSEHDDLVDENVKTAFFHLLEQADNLLVVISKYTDPEAKWLNWQISRAVNRYHLPVIVAFADETCVTDETLKAYWSKLPAKIKKYIGRDSARMCYIPLTQSKMERALDYFSVKTQTYPWNSTTIY